MHMSVRVNLQLFMRDPTSFSRTHKCTNKQLG